MTYEEIREYDYDFRHDDFYNSYESSFTSRYDSAACYDDFCGMSDALVDDMVRSFSLRVSVRCF